MTNKSSTTNRLSSLANQAQQKLAWKSYLEIKIGMEQMSYSHSDLAKIVGLKSRASEFFTKKRKLSLEMARQLHERLNISTDVLIQSY